MSTVLHAVPFVYDDRLTMVIATDDGGHRLAHLIDGTWTYGRRVLFPGIDRTWYHDAQRDRTALLPLTSVTPPGGRISLQLVLTVIQQDQHTHLFVAGYPEFAAYRDGFEFLEEPSETASALAPENSEHDVSGWEPIDFNRTTDHFDQMVCDQEGPIFHASGRSQSNRSKRSGRPVEDTDGFGTSRQYRRGPFVG